MRKLAWLVVLTVGGTAAALPPASVPQELSVQGVLRDNMGKLQSKTSTVVAGLWDDVSAGTNIVTYSVFSGVPVVNGLFTIKIADASLLAHVGGHAATGLWLELTVDGDTYPRQKIEPEAFSIMSLQADSLSSACSNCVTDAMINTVAFGKITGTVNATQLNGQTASFYQQALSSSTCVSPNFVQSIAANGAVTCTPVITSVGIGTASSGLSASNTSGAVSITVAPSNTSVLQHSLTGHNLNSQSEGGAMGGQFCAAGEAMAGILGDGFFECVNSVSNATNATTAATANDLSCAGCITTAEIGAKQVTAAKIADNTITSAQISPDSITITAGKLAAAAKVTANSGTQQAIPYSGCGQPSYIVCDSCVATSGGVTTVVVGGSCVVNDTNPFPPITSQGAGPLSNVSNPSPNPAPSPNPTGSSWCCAAQPGPGGGCGNNTLTITAKANCLTFNAITIP